MTVSDFPFDVLERPPAIIRPVAREIILGRHAQHITLVSEEDYEFLIRWRWNFKVSRGGAVYARRGGGWADRESRICRPTILMHDVVMIERMGLPRPGEDYSVHHIDCNSLNNQRENLEWATSSQQQKYKGRKR